MKRYEALTRYIDALDCEELGEWVTEYDSQGRLTGTPYVDYWDVVHRFCTTLDDQPDEPGVPGAEIIAALKSAVSREERCPGVLLGYLNNGAVVEWLRELYALDNPQSAPKK